MYPPALRCQLSRAWGVDVAKRWLPDNEGHSDSTREAEESIGYRAGTLASSSGTDDNRGQK